MEMEMEQPAYYYLFLALLLPTLLLLMKNLSIMKKRGGVAVRLPPGPWQLPLIGSLHHLAGNPLTHRVMAELARRLDAPLMYLKLGEVPVVVATSPEAASEILRTHDQVFATRPWTPTIKIIKEDGEGVIFARYGAMWRQIRKICVVELLSPRRVQSFRHIREEEVGRLVTELQLSSSSDGEAVNVSDRVSALITDSAMRAMLGDRFKRTDEFLHTLHESVKLVNGFNLADLFPSSWLVSFLTGTARLAKETHRQMFDLMDYAIKQHQEQRRDPATAAQQGGEDLVDVLLRIQKEGGLDLPLTTEMVKGVIFDLFGALSDTSTTTLLWAMSELIRHPMVMHKAQAQVRHKLQGKSKVTEDDLPNLTYLKLVIKETLRLHPPVPILLREAMEPRNILGYDIPKGTKVAINTWAISRDPKHWQDPEEFKPERFDSGMLDYKGTNFEYLPFGSGRRMCPGIVFGEATMEIVLATLLYNFDWKLPCGVKPNEVDMSEEMGLAVSRKKDLYLHALVYVPPS